jgi:hypothetical protein
MGGKCVDVTSANSGSVGAPYRIAAPKEYTVERGKRRGRPDDDHLDVYITNAAQTHEVALLSYAWEGLSNGTLSPKTVTLVRAGWLRDKQRVAVPGTSAATVAGVRATGFDYTYTSPGGAKYRGRVLFFGHGGTLHTALFYAPAKTFAATVPTLERIAATMKFTGPSTRVRGQTATT